MSLPGLSRRDRAELCCESGEHVLRRGDFGAARDSFLAAIRLFPSLSSAHLGLAKAERQLGRMKEAEQAARAALQADPRCGRAAHYLGSLMVEQGRLAEGLPLLQSGAVREPNVAQHHRDLAITQMYLGDIAGGRESLIRTLDLDRHSHEVLYGLIDVLKMNDGSELSSRVLQIAEELAAESESLPAVECAQIFFGLGKAYEDLNRIAEATDCYARANSTKRSLIAYDVTQAEERYAAIARHFDETFFRRHRGKGVHDARPIFIVGMPRSGSTLVEQLLCAHPEVHGAGEIYRLPPIINGSTGQGGARFPDWVGAMNETDCIALARAYLDGLPHGLGGEIRTTDKWLENLEYLGLISVCLPQARIIHCRRDPRDQLFSCWTRLFSMGQEYAYDIDELRRYHQAYEMLMSHWRKVLPHGQMLEVQYESLVTTFEDNARRIVSYSGLDWDDHVLRFWEARRAVKSASLAQVREPIYSRSIGRWKRFGTTLAPLFGDLA
jgi:tetratricopeptide (TPR) repeat protein